MPSNSVAIRHSRRHWPEPEQLLAVENELIITRDGIPVAKFVVLSREQQTRKRFDSAAHVRCEKQMSGDRIIRSVDEMTARQQADRTHS